MKSLIVLALFVAAAEAWFFPKQTKPEWRSLYVTFGTFDKLPTTEDKAIAAGWRMDKACSAKNYFAGNRYIFYGDTAVMLLFGVNGQLAGIQMGVDRSIVGVKRNPWVQEGNMYVMTAYFRDPSTICSCPEKRKYYGDRLLILDRTTNRTIDIPYREQDLEGSKWVAGRCYPWMGQHYWYDISANMDCRDFYPVFIMYNGKRLDSFGWTTNGYLKSHRFDQLTSQRLKCLFRKRTLPKCLHTNGPMSIQHIYMDSPYTNFCIF